MPDHVPSLSKLGALLIDLGRPRDAIVYLERALAVNPTPGDWTAYGVALALDGRHDEALSAFDVSLIFEPDQTEARINKAGTLITAGRYADAVPELRAVLERDPRSVVAQTNLAMAYAGLGQDVVLLGVLNRVEVWSKDKWTQEIAYMLRQSHTSSPELASRGI